MARKIKQAEVISTNDSYEKEDKEALSTTRTVVGCLRGTIAGSASLMCAIAGGIGVGIESGTGFGILAGMGLFFVLMGFSVYLMNNAKNLTVVDCILPLPIGVISAFLFAPVSLFAGSIFSAATCLGASLLLSIMLLMYRAKKIHGGMLVIPFLVFIYELLPIELPTDLDNLFCLGGNGVNFIASLVFRPDNPKLLE
ncbi:MAG: hypothetical protein ACI351_07105 [Candidatus Avelusimicrobium sp.]|uniref:hypothetical protein n=1 Tax=Candidatus Avelusimicrobium sp. TaxID=3048833 RepID=UPI003F024B7C